LGETAGSKLEEGGVTLGERSASGKKRKTHTKTGVKIRRESQSSRKKKETKDTQAPEIRQREKRAILEKEWEKIIKHQ